MCIQQHTLILEGKYEISEEIKMRITADNQCYLFIAHIQSPELSTENYKLKYTHQC